MSADLKLFRCIEGHEVYASEEQINEQLFCKHPQYHAGVLSWCGLPMFLAQDQSIEDQK